MRKWRVSSLSPGVGIADRGQPCAQFLSQGQAGHEKGQAQKERAGFPYGRGNALVGEAAYLGLIFGTGCVTLNESLGLSGSQPCLSPSRGGLSIQEIL